MPTDTDRMIADVAPWNPSVPCLPLSDRTKALVRAASNRQRSLGANGDLVRVMVLMPQTLTKPRTFSLVYAQDIDAVGVHGEPLVSAVHCAVLTTLMKCQP